MNESNNVKMKVREFWDRNPCGLRFTRLEPSTQEFFEDLEKFRYQTEWHIPLVARFEKQRDKRVLEIGCGIGLDGSQFARSGAEYTAIEMSLNSLELARQRFKLLGIEGKFVLADTESLPFRSNAFDTIYSWGVLHHTPNTQGAVNEAHRVLRGNGEITVMLYYKNSYNYWVNIMLLRRLGASLLLFNLGLKLVQRLTGESVKILEGHQKLLRKFGFRYLLSNRMFLSKNTDGPENPLTKVYSKREALKMFSGFRNVNCKAYFLHKKWIPIWGRYLPLFVEKKLATLFGWHLVISGRK